MKKIVYLLTLVIFSSCATASYKDVFTSTNAIDLRNTRCLVNNISTDLYTLDIEKINTILLDALKKEKNLSCTHVKDLKTKDLMKSKIPFDTNAKDLNLLKRSNKYDYLVNLSAKITSERNLNLSYVETELELRIYSINDGELFYSHKVLGKADVDPLIRADKNKDSVKTSFFKDFFTKEAKTRDSQAQNLIIESLEKALKTIHKH